MLLKPGALLDRGKYRIIEPLGQGGFGVTYLAEQVMAKRKVCIKEFFPKDYYMRDEGVDSISIISKGHVDLMSRFKAKFIKEAQTIAALDHPNIIHIHEIFEDNNTAYYAMDYVEGGSLNALVKNNGVLSEAEAVKYIREIASALDYIHERKIMHLDIKPSNIMISASDDHSVLIDFGLAKHYDEKSGDATSTTPVGVSHGYAPMEQYKQGGVCHFSPETDIYSLGATLFYLLSGTVPPQAADVAYDGLPELPKHVSLSVCHAITQAMAWNIKERPHTIKEFMALLDGSAQMVATPVPTPIVAPTPVPAQDMSEETIVPEVSKAVVGESTVISTPRPQQGEHKNEASPALKISLDRGAMSSIFNSISLIGASLQFVIAFCMRFIFQHISAHSYHTTNKDILEHLSMWTMVIFSLLSVTLLIAVIKRNSRVAVALAIGTLISYLLIDSGLSEMREADGMPSFLGGDSSEIVNWVMLSSILMAGAGAFFSHRVSMQEGGDRRLASDGCGTNMVLTILFALMYILPLFYPTWAQNVAKDHMEYLWDESYVNMGYIAATVGIAGVACGRYKTSLMAAIFALVAMPITIFSKYYLNYMFEQDSGYFDYLRERGIDLGVSDYSLTMSNYFPMIIAIALVVMILGLTLSKQSSDERWYSAIPIVPAMLLVCLGWCPGAISSNMYGGYDGACLADSHEDYFLLYNVFAFATLILAFCRQNRITILSSLVVAVLAMIMISKADKIESSLVVYGVVASAVATMLFTAYSQIREHRSTHYDVVAVIFAVLALDFAYEGISMIYHFMGDYRVLTFLLFPLLIALVYSMRRNKLMMLFMAVAILVILYIIHDKTIDTEEFSIYVNDVMSEKDRSKVETLLFVVKCAKLLLVAAILYSLFKETIKRFVKGSSANN